MDSKIQSDVDELYGQLCDAVRMGEGVHTLWVEFNKIMMSGGPLPTAWAMFPNIEECGE